MIWNELTQFDKDNIKYLYNKISKQIQQENSIKANRSKKHTYTQQEQIAYNERIKLLQQKYNTICTDYRCDYCNNVFHLTLSKMKELFKSNNPQFCSKQCSGKYYARKSHEGKTESEKQVIRDKISKTLKSKDSIWTPEQENRMKKQIARYWNSMTSEQRSKRNSRSCFVAMKNNKDKTIWTSSAEKLIFKCLSERKLEIYEQKYSGGFLFDFLINYNQQKTLLELNGIYWHHNKPFNNTESDINEYNMLINSSERNRNIANKWRYADVAKLNYCKENNINLIIIYFDRQINRNTELVCDMIEENLNKGIKIILSSDIDKYIVNK